MSETVVPNNAEPSDSESTKDQPKKVAQSLTLPPSGTRTPASEAARARSL